LDYRTADTSGSVTTSGLSRRLQRSSGHISRAVKTAREALFKSAVRLEHVEGWMVNP
jgi:hypothetical protein